jgi:hypothetical protein
VIVHEGTYWLPEPFELGAEDGGAAAAPVVYRAAEGETVWLNGGTPLRLADFLPVTDQRILDRLPQERTGRLVAYRYSTVAVGRKPTGFTIPDGSRRSAGFYDSRHGIRRL